MSRILKITGPRIGVSYEVTAARNGIVVGKLLNVEEGIAQILVERRRHFLYQRRLVNKGDVIRVPVALTLFEEVEA